MSISQRRIDSLRAMAKSGTKHEQETARSILSRLNIKEVSEEPIEYHDFKVKDEFESTLFLQVARMILGHDVNVYGRKRRRNLAVIKCTESERTEIDLFYESYRKALKDEMVTTLSAFVQRNKIFSTYQLENPVEADTPERRKIANRAQDMDSVEIRKRIAAGSAP